MSALVILDVKCAGTSGYAGFSWPCTFAGDEDVTVDGTRIFWTCPVCGTENVITGVTE